MSRLKIPPDIHRQLIPNETLPIPEFLNFTLPSVVPQTTPFDPLDYLCIGTPTITDACKIQSLSVPTVEVITQLLILADINDYASIQCQDDRFPLWVLTYWKEVHQLHRTQHTWMAAMKGLQEVSREEASRTEKSSSGLVERVTEALASIPWSGYVRGFNTKASLESLATYATSAWLTDDHESQLLELLEQELVRGGEADHIYVGNIFFITMLERAYDNRDGYLEKRDYQWLRNLGQKLTMGLHEQLAVITNIGGNHWVAIAVDFKAQEILYGDSLGHTITDELRNIINWWTYLHTGHHFMHRHLPITHQLDGFSCGILAWNALATFFLQPCCQLMDPKRARVERLEVLLAILERHNGQVCVATN